MSGLKVLVVLGSTREGRMCERVANMLIKQLEKCSVTPHKLDPLVLNPPTVTQPMHFMKDPSLAPEWMVTTNNIIKECHGVLVVTSEYNCALPPALTNILDYFPPASFRHKPASIASYSMGPFGGLRAAALARPFLSEMGMVSLPSTLTVPTVQSAGIEENGDTENERILKNSEKLVNELIFYMQAIKIQAEADGKYPN